MSTERPEPPAAKRIPTERTYHGDTFVDEYAWLADKENPGTIAFLEAENAYTEAMTAGQAGLRETIFGEIKGRTKETDLSVPTRKRGWWYYARTVEGQQYAVHCRRAVRGERRGVCAEQRACGHRPGAAEPARARPRRQRARARG